jgi:NAD(P)-dependent dehydrogenase (short-subunit alcohol dehydrogenase family)
MNAESRARGVVVTGGTRGIGLAIARRFLARGERVAVCSRGPRPADLPDAIVHRSVDVRCRAALEDFFETVTRELGAFDVLVNNAGTSRWRRTQEIDEAFVEEVVETALLGTLWSCSVAASRLGPNGVIVNVSSLAGKRGSANNSAYCAAKFGVNGITQALAKELGPRGIRVNAVCPVYVPTTGVKAALEDPASPAAAEGVDVYLAGFAATQTALGRLPTADEVAEVVYFLASDAAAAITGQCINVDCGVLPQ